MDLGTSKARRAGYYECWFDLWHKADLATADVTVAVAPSLFADRSVPDLGEQ